jgi:excisionase family DNA binding protein
MTTATSPTEQWLSVNEVAEIIGKTADTIYNARALGYPVPPAYKVGRRLRFKASEVAAWMEQRREKSAGPPLTQPAPAAAPTPTTRTAQKPWEVRT